VLNISKLQEGTIPKSSEHDSARKGVDHDANQVSCWVVEGYDEQVDKLGITGYSDVKRKYFDI
jgi:hypothetical protein